MYSRLKVRAVLRKFLDLTYVFIDFSLFDQSQNRYISYNERSNVSECYYCFISISYM